MKRGSGLLVVCVLGLAACGEAPETHPPGLDGLPDLAAVETLRLGSVDDPDVGFSFVRDVDVDRNGRIYVAEARDREIRVYDRDGGLLHRFGGAGEGPGEFMELWSFGVQGDTVWALDPRQQRTTLFDPGGTLLSTGSWASIAIPVAAGRIFYIVPRSMRLDGLFWGGPGFEAMVIGADAPEPTDSIRIPLALFDASGDVVDTVGWDVRSRSGAGPGERVEVGSGRYTVPRAPSDEALDLAYPGGRWIVEREAASSPGSADLRITRIGLDGDTAFNRTYRYTPRPFPEEVLDSIALAGVGSEEAGREEARRAIRAAMDFPAFQPPVTRGMAAADGTLWLRREDAGGASDRWLVIATDGTPRGHVEMPKDARLRWVDAGGFIVVRADELGIPWVLRYRIGA